MPKKITINGYTYDWGALRPRFRKVRKELPLQMATVAQNFFVGSFQRQGWYDGLTLKRWTPRKGENMCGGCAFGRSPFFVTENG